MALFVRWRRSGGPLATRTDLIAPLISFRFTIYKFFQYQIERGQAAAPGRLSGPRAFALMTISH
jgi:hypothetical protein